MSRAYGYGMLLSSALAAVLLFLAGCAPSVTEPDIRPPWPPSPVGAKTIYVLSHGWHTGVAVKRADVPEALWPEQLDFAGMTYLEFGWGDENFYRAREVTFAMTLKAALTPTDAVLHVAGFDQPVLQYFPRSGVVELRVSGQGLRGLLQYISDTVDRDDGKRAVALGPGLYANTRFYKATGTYSLFNNCNHWIARALSMTGAPVRPRDATTAGALFEQASSLGLVLRVPP